MDGDLAVGVLVVVPAVPAPVLRPAAGHREFYNRYQSAARGAGEAVRRARGARRRCPSRPTRRPLPHPAAGEVVFDGVRFGYRRRDGAAAPGPGHPGRADGGAGRRDRRGQVHARPADRPVLRPGRRARCGWTASPLRPLADADLRRAVVMVTQESFLFSGSVADNIAFGKPGATRAEVEEAARAIGARHVHPGAARGLRHRRRQARRPAVGRAAPTGQLRPRVPRRPGGAGPGRGDALPRHARASGWSSGRCRRCWPTGRR